MNDAMLRRALAKLVKKMTEPLARRIRLVASRGTITSVDDSAGVQLCQVTLFSGEVLQDVQVVQLWGTSGCVPTGATCVVLCMGGSRTHPVVIAVDHPTLRFTDLQLGEWVAYNDKGDFIRLRADSTAHVSAATKVLCETPLFHCTGKIKADGDVSDATGSMQTMRDQHNTHGHPTAPSGPVSAPNVLMT